METPLRSTLFSERDKDRQKGEERQIAQERERETAIQTAQIDRKI